MTRQHRLLHIFENSTTQSFSPLRCTPLHFSHQTSNSSTNGMAPNEPSLVINSRIFSKSTRIGT